MQLKHFGRIWLKRVRENREIEIILYLKWVKVYKSWRHFYFQLVSGLVAFIGGEVANYVAEAETKCGGLRGLP